MATPTLLRHIHLHSSLPFSLIQSIQSHLVSQQLAYKALLSSRTSPISPQPPPPPPTILSFQTSPVYTLGRRESLQSLTPSYRKLLTLPLTNPQASNTNPYAWPEWPTVEETLRGGQITFHGPGQVVIYVIMDIKSHFRMIPHGLDVRSFVSLLEDTTISTLRRWDLEGIRTDNPGVWEPSGEKKVAALGVHLRRNISSFGVGLNISTDLRWFDRIVACGLDGKGVTSMREMAKEQRQMNWSGTTLVSGKPQDHRKGRRIKLKPCRVVRTWTKEFATALWGRDGEERIRSVGWEEVGMLKDVMRFYLQNGK